MMFISAQIISSRYLYKNVNSNGRRGIILSIKSPKTIVANIRLAHEPKDLSLKFIVKAEIFIINLISNKKFGLVTDKYGLILFHFLSKFSINKSSS